MKNYKISPPQTNKIKWLKSNELSRFIILFFLKMIQITLPFLHCANNLEELILIIIFTQLEVLNESQSYRKINQSLAHFKAK